MPQVTRDAIRYEPLGPVVLPVAQAVLIFGIVHVNVIAVAVVVIVIRRQAGKLAARAEEAYPGPLE